MSIGVGFSFPSRLYVIIDPAGVPGRDHLALARMLVSSGVPLVQLRVKGANTRHFVDIAQVVAELCRATKTMFIINDRADIAQLVAADGVHLGQDDPPPAEVRKWLGRNKIIGWSTHNLEQARFAEAIGSVDYIGVGPIFPTTTKVNPDPVVGLDGLRAIRAAVRLPIVAIGGITPETAPAVLAAGADAVAMITPFARAPDPAALARKLRVTLDRAM